jgi:hypothetical protein
VVGAFTKPMKAEEFADSMESGLEYFFREKLNASSLFTIAATEILQGRGGFCIKVVRDKKVKRTYDHVIAPVRDTANAEIRGTTVRRFESGCGTRLVPVSVYNTLLPVDYDDIQLSPWFGERFYSSASELRAIIDSYKCLVPEDKRQELVSSVMDIKQPELDTKQRIANSFSSTPRRGHEMIEVWFRMAVPLTNGAKGKKAEKRWEEREFCAYWHIGSQQFLSIWENPYQHQCRPYIPFFQRKKPFSFSSGSLASDLAAQQELVSEIITLTMKNAAVANTSPLVVNPDSDAMEWLSRYDVDSSSVIPGNKDDVISVPFGAGYRSMMPEVDWLVGDADRTSNISEYEDGSRIPGRTSPNTVNQIMSSGANQQMLVLRAFGDSWSQVVKLWLLTHRQYSPGSVPVPTKNPEERGKTEAMFALPTEIDVLDNFRFTLTASEEAASRETEIEPLSMVANMLDNDARVIAEILAPLAQPGTPPEIWEAFALFITRKQAIVEQLLRLFRVDAKKLTLNEDMLAAIKSMALRQQQQLMMQQQQEMMNAGQGNPAAPPPQGGGALPAPPGPDGGAAPPGPPQEPGLQEMAGPMPPEGLPPEML